MEPDDDVYAEGRPYELSHALLDSMLHEAIKRYRHYLRTSRSSSVAADRAVQAILDILASDDDPGQEPDPDEVPF